MKINVVIHAQVEYRTQIELTRAAYERLRARFESNAPEETRVARELLESAGLRLADARPFGEMSVDKFDALDPQHPGKRSAFR